MERLGNAPTGYEAALNRAAWFLVPDGGYLRLGGPDRIDFLQRQSTNDVRTLADNGVVSTVLTSPTARLLDVLTLVMEDDALGIMTLPGRGGATVHFLRSRIFFMDKVTVQDASSEIAQIELVGRQVQELGRSWNLDMPHVGTLTAVQIKGVAFRLLGTEVFIGAGYRLLVQRKNVDQVVTWLDEKGLETLSAESYEVLRIEAGRPGYQRELTEEYTPLEVGLSHLISDQKGCYTGQEVIARQITHDKVTRYLAGIAMSEPVREGATIQADGRTVGQITSVALSPRFGPIGLGVIKRPHNHPGTPVRLLDGDQDIAGTVRALPFASQ